MNRLACVIATVFVLLAACGKADPQPAPEQPPAQTQPNEQSSNGEKPDPEPDAPANPEPWREVEGKVPEGWHALGREGRQELLKRIKGLPDDARFVADIASERAPGPTKPDSAWQEWAEKASGAILYFVSPEEFPALDFLDQHVAGIIEDMGERTESGSMAWTESEDDSVTVIALQLEHGSYLVLGFSPANDDGIEAREQIRTWAMSVKGKK